MSFSIINPENQPVVLVVVFVLALLALGLTVHNNLQIERVAAFYGATSVQTFETLQDQVGDTSTNFATLEARVARLESQGVAAPAPEVGVN